jgi:YD repeat-containing protein
LTASYRGEVVVLVAYGYGNLGLLTTRTDALTHVESRAYDIAGMLAQVTDRKGQVSGLTYDNRNRLCHGSPNNPHFGS